MAASISSATPPLAPYSQTTDGKRFRQISGSDDESMRVITEIFHRILTPLYGPQDKAIAQLAAGEDRKGFLMYDGESPVGVLAFKTRPTDEFASSGVTSSIEIKSLFVDHAAQNSGRGLGSSLLSKLDEEIKLLGMENAGVHVTVSETKPESLAFFQKKGFRIVSEWEGKYIPGVKEYLLARAGIQ